MHMEVIQIRTAPEYPDLFNVLEDTSTLFKTEHATEDISRTTGLSYPASTVLDTPYNLNRYVLCHEANSIWTGSLVGRLVLLT